MSTSNLPPEHEIARTLTDLEHDVELEKEVLPESINTDYSTSEHGIVPLNRRRPLWHFIALFLTFEAGFSYVFVGFTLHDAGYTLAQTAGLLALGVFIYLVYALFAAYLGSRTGQTHTLLTRSILGKYGSWLVSLFVIITYMGWTGFQANLLAQLWNGLYGWPVLGIGVALGFVMVINNVFGFTGITMFSRYIVAPILILWIAYLVIKGFTTESSHFLGAHPHANTPLATLPAITLVTGFVIWGMEPDFWRYGKPRFWWSSIPFIVALYPGFLLMAVGGWIVGQLGSGHSTFGASVKVTTNYSLFGAFWLAWIVATVTQVALNDGNYYAMINAMQNVVGGWRRWRRIFACAIAACLAALGAWLVPYVIPTGFFKLASFTAIGIPCATVIMVVDHFLLPRQFKISRSMLRVPAWGDVAAFNIPGVIALIAAVGFGAYASGLLTFFGESSSTSWGLPAPESWALAAVLYVVGVAITKAVTKTKKEMTGALGFAKFLNPEDAASGAIVDVTSATGSTDGRRVGEPAVPAGTTTG